MKVTSPRHGNTIALHYILSLSLSLSFSFSLHLRSCISLSSSLSNKRTQSVLITRLCSPAGALARALVDDVSRHSCFCSCVRVRTLGGVAGRGLGDEGMGGKRERKEQLHLQIHPFCTVCWVVKINSTTPVHVYLVLCINHPLSFAFFPFISCSMA